MPANVALLCARAGQLCTGCDDIPEIVDVIFEVVFPEIAAHVPSVGGSLPEFRRVPAPRYDLKDQSVFKGAGCETRVRLQKSAPNAIVRQVYLLYMSYIELGVSRACIAISVRVTGVTRLFAVSGKLSERGCSSQLC